MARRKKAAKPYAFPPRITAILERPEREEPYLQVVDHIDDVAEPCEAAIYQLVKSGRVSIQKNFETDATDTE